MSTLFTNFFENINQITPLGHDFTEVLDTIALKPKTLYFHGKLPENMVKMRNPVKITQHEIDVKSSPKARTSRPKTVAIVGSRHSTRYGEEIAYRLAYELAKKGVVIVSGLAFGIDTVAHRGCLDAGGITVAVLGTAIDDIYPKPHEPVARRIIEQGGAIISEYAPHTTEYRDTPLAPAEYYDKDTRQRKLDPKSSFLYRNRLISGLSDVVVVVEAAERSGSLNTAAHAIEQGKDVFALPGNITSPYSQGCNKLIRQGALPYTEPVDVLRELFPEDYIQQYKRIKRQDLIGDTDVETKILQALAAGARTSEEITSLTHLPPEVFNQTVTLLEIKSRLRPLGMGTWSLA